MKIATYKLLFLFEGGIHTHSGKEWNYSAKLVAARISYFAGIFSSTDADFLFLQEVASESVLQRIIEQSGIGYSYFLGVPDVNGVGNAVLYKGEAKCFSIPATSSLPVFLEGDTDSLGERIFSRRDFVGLKVKYAKREVLMLGLHLKANFLIGMKRTNGEVISMDSQLDGADGLIRSEFFRFAQARKAREVIDQFLSGKPEREVVVAGDFNAREGGVPLEMIKGVLEGSGQLTDAIDWLPEEERVNFSGKPPVDHILLSEGLTASLRSVQILNKEEKAFKDVPPNPTAVGSDHLLVMVELQ